MHARSPIHADRVNKVAGSLYLMIVALVSLTIAGVGGFIG